MRRHTTIRWGCACAVLLISGLPAFGQTGGTRSPITPAEVIEWRRPSQVDLSPDAARVLFRLMRFDLAANAIESAIWMHDTDGGETRRLTQGEGSHRLPRWSPDGREFAFLSDRDGSTQLWVMPGDGGEARRLTEHAGALTDFSWSPDGSRLAFTASADEAAEAGNDAYVFGEPRGRARLWLHDLSSDASHALTGPEMSVEEFAWSPEGDRIAYIGRPTTLLDFIGEREIYVVDAGENDHEARRLTDNQAVEAGVVWAPSGDALLYTAPDATRFINAESKLYRIELSTGAVERLGAQVATGITAVRPIGEGERLLYLAGVGVTQGLFALPADAAGGEPLWPARDTVSEYDVEAGRVVMIRSDAANLPELWLGALGGAGGVERLTRLNPQAAGWALGETRAERWRSADGWEVEGLLTLPVGHTVGERVPLLVMIHGGPEAAHTLELSPNYIDSPQLWAGRGWAVLRVNYRGGTNYGDRFLQGMNGDSGGGDYRDIMTGVDHVIALGVADPERMAVMGWSWGGISTGWIVTQTDRFRAASAGAMVSNHFSVFGQADLTFDVRQFYIGGSPWEDPARYLRMSPIGHVQAAATPTLLVHGEADERCPLPQSVEFHKALESVGVETELVIYPREPHVFREPRHMLDKIEREMAWFDRHVLGDVPPLQ